MGFMCLKILKCVLVVAREFVSVVYVIFSTRFHFFPAGLASIIQAGFAVFDGFFVLFTLLINIGQIGVSSENNDPIIVGPGDFQGFVAVFIGAFFVSKFHIRISQAVRIIRFKRGAGGVRNIFFYFLVVIQRFFVILNPKRIVIIVIAQKVVNPAEVIFVFGGFGVG